MMRILFCGGGTAGHVNPAIAVAQTVERNMPDSKIAYVTTMNGIENSIVAYKKFKIDVIGFKRSFCRENFKFFTKLISAKKQCLRILEEFHPDVIFGTGGYATYPVIVAGRELGIKTILHESNVVPGKATLALEKKLDKILVNFKESEKYFKGKTKIIHTGNPIRVFPTFDKVSCIKEKLGIKTKYVILCTGGSLGATRINDSALEIADNLVRYSEDITLIWSTGKNHYDEVKNSIKSRGLMLGERIIVKDYFDNLLEYICISDVVISRSGAMTISELAIMKKCAILVPSPNVTNNHQLKNARALERKEAAVLLTEDQLYKIVDITKDLISNYELRENLSANIEKFSIKNANKRIYDEIVDLIN